MAIALDSVSRPASMPARFAGEDRRERLAGLDPIARPRGDDESDRRVDDVFDARAPAAQLA